MCWPSLRDRPVFEHCPDCWTNVRTRTNCRTNVRTLKPNVRTIANAEKLNKRSAQLKTDYKGVEVQTITTDFSKNDSIEYFEGLLDQIKVDDVAMLINAQGQNCGFFMTESIDSLRSVSNKLSQHFGSKMITTGRKPLKYSQ